MSTSVAASGVGPTVDKSVWVYLFRTVAFLEAASWIALLIAMAVKYGLDREEATMVPGMVHGIMFVIYLVATLIVAVLYRWSWKLAVVGLLAAIPPTATIFFERSVVRSGNLAPARKRDRGLAAGV